MTSQTSLSVAVMPSIESALTNQLAQFVQTLRLASLRLANCQEARLGRLAPDWQHRCLRFIREATQSEFSEVRYSQPTRQISAQASCDMIETEMTFHHLTSHSISPSYDSIFLSRTLFFHNGQLNRTCMGLTNTWCTLTFTFFSDTADMKFCNDNASSNDKLTPFDAATNTFLKSPNPMPRPSQPNTSTKSTTTSPPPSPPPSPEPPAHSRTPSPSPPQTRPPPQLSLVPPSSPPL